MIVSIDGNNYDVKTSFSEYTLTEFVCVIESIELSLIERVSVASNIPVEVLSKLSLANFNNIISMVEFVEDEKTLNAICEPAECINVGLLSFEKIEAAKSFLSENKKIEAVEVYTGAISNKQLLSVWYQYSFYLNSLLNFFQKFKRLTETTYTDIEIAAGVEVFEKFKHYPVVFKMAQSRGMTNNEVLEMTAIEVYTELLFEFEKEKYSERYKEIYEQVTGANRKV